MVNSCNVVYVSLYFPFTSMGAPPVYSPRFEFFGIPSLLVLLMVWLFYIHFARSLRSSVYVFLVFLLCGSYTLGVWELRLLVYPHRKSYPILRLLCLAFDSRAECLVLLFSHPRSGIGVFEHFVDFPFFHNVMGSRRHSFARVVFFSGLGFLAFVLGFHFILLYCYAFL